MSVARLWRKQKAMYNLIGTHCENCDTYHYPPRTICPKCRRASRIVQYQFEGTGKVESFTAVHSGSNGFEEQTPYILAIIRLDEGPTLTSIIVNVTEEDVDIGMKVQSTFRKLGEDGEKGIIYYGTKFEPVIEENQEELTENITER